jgi:gas vesicle protein
MSKSLLKVITVAAAGFAAGVLLAPKSGKATRQDIKNKAKDAKKYADKQVDLAKDIGAEGLETVKSTAKRAKHEADDLVKSTKSSAKVVAAEAKKLSGEAKVRAERVSKDAKRTAEKVTKDAKAHVK